MLHVIAPGMDKHEEELGRGGGGGVLVGLAGLGELPPGSVWLCLSPVDGRDQEPLPIWDSNTDSHFRRALSQVRVLVVTGPRSRLQYGHHSQSRPWVFHSIAVVTSPTAPAHDSFPYD